MVAPERLTSFTEPAGRVQALGLVHAEIARGRLRERRVARALRGCRGPLADEEAPSELLRARRRTRRSCSRDRPLPRRFRPCCRRRGSFVPDGQCIRGTALPGLPVPLRRRVPAGPAGPAGICPTAKSTARSERLRTFGLVMALFRTFAVATALSLQLGRPDAVPWDELSRLQRPRSIPLERDEQGKASDDHRGRRYGVVHRVTRSPLL